MTQKAIRDFTSCLMWHVARHTYVCLLPSIHFVSFVAATVLSFALFVSASQKVSESLALFLFYSQVIFVSEKDAFSKSKTNFLCITCSVFLLTRLYKRHSTVPAFLCIKFISNMSNNSQETATLIILRTSDAAKAEVRQKPVFLFSCVVLF